MIKREKVAELLKSSGDLLQLLSMDIEQSRDDREVKKFNEVIGFVEQVVEIVEGYPRDREIVILDCSCGKSYLSFALNNILSRLYPMQFFFYGVDTNKTLIEKCNQIRDRLGYNNMRFMDGRIIDAQPEKTIDIVVALHACDVATDETIAKGIKLGAKYILAVPCCENQVRGRIKRGHPLVDITDFGLLRYRFADILTEALRSQFLTGAGYVVKLIEMVPPKVSPKNLMIIARRKKGKKKCNLERYHKMDKTFNTEFVLKSYFSEQEFGSEVGDYSVNCL